MNNLLRRLLFSRTVARSSQNTAYALLEACIIGLFSALAAILLRQGIDWLGSYRLEAVSLWGKLAVLPLMGLMGGFLSGWIIENFGPEAQGGGIPQVKAALAGYPILLSLRIAVVKILGSILVLGSGLVLGRRAPTVHIGAALAAELSTWVPTTPEHRRQMIAAGAAAGLAASFNTPIAGVIFVIEELMRDASSLTLETAILASFIGSVVSLNLVGPGDLIITPGMIQSDTAEFSYIELLSYGILGLLAGGLGGLFNRFILFNMSVYKRIKCSQAWKFALCGTVSGLLIAFLPDFFQDNTGLSQFLIDSHGHLDVMLLTFFSYFILTPLAAGSGAPGGLLAPALILGAALGDIVGTLEWDILGQGNEYFYILTGMGAFFTAVVRVPVTAIIIVFEMTKDFDLVLPLMIACAASYFVGELVTKGSIYHHLLALTGISLEDQEDGNYFLKGLSAAEVMQSEVETLDGDTPLQEIRQFMARSSHRGFPVLSRGKMVGIFTQSDLAQLGNRPGHTPLKKVMTPRPITISPDASLGNALYLLNRYKLSRLPVTIGDELLGIITRSDIIQAEAQWLGGTGPYVSKSKLYYSVYQTRAPEQGHGRIILPLANPYTAPYLFKIAAAIAFYYNYEVECLQIIPLANHQTPREAKVNLNPARSLMLRAEKWGKRQKIGVHTQICLATNVGETILNLTSQGNVKLLLMGWKGKTLTPDAVFGSLVDTLIAEAPCDLALVKLGESDHFYPQQLNLNHNWLIPFAGGPNVQRAIQLLPALTSFYSERPPFLICQVFPSNQLEPNLGAAKTALSWLTNELHGKGQLLAIPGDNIGDSIIKIAENHQSQVVILGTSREGLLKQLVQGNIPAEIANQVKSTVILVRGALNPGKGMG